MGGFNTSLSPMVIWKKKLNKEGLELGEIINSMYLTDIYGSLHQNSENSASQGTFSKIDHTLGYKENLSKYRKIEIASYFYLTTIE